MISQEHLYTNRQAIPYLMHCSESIVCLPDADFRTR